MQQEEQFVARLESFLKLRAICDEHYDAAQAHNARPAEFILNVLEDRRLSHDEKIDLLEILLHSCNVVVEHL